ncbi:MAG TPA: serine/threonine-protein kinase [Gemmatimonadaceae bacterium]|nr:serine/threonine-protein kinase [Gemmatimonadaceae bacterium]
MTTPRTPLAEALSDRYTIEREVGAGGMATVYLAHDKKHERKVALKVLRPELSSAMGSDRFPREIKLVAQFNHPHILSLYDSGESAGFLYYVMPFVEGESLRDRLTRERQLPINDAIRILHEVADALAYSHARGVVHRDIKPANVLLSGRHAVVTDFGVAKALTASGGDKVTTVGIAVGTPQYMAPEQAMGESNIDHRADIYALGILGYEMIGGRPPFEAGSSQAVLAAQVMEAPVDLQQLRPGIAPLLSDAVMRCLAKNPADRWQTAEEVITRLEAVAATPSGGVTPTDTRPWQATKARKTKTSSRPAWLVPVAATALVAAVVVGGWFAMSGRGGGGIQKIGVMPIEDISGQDSLFVTAMHDALTNALSRLNLAGVVPRSTMMRYKGAANTIRDIARENELNAVIEATVFRAGDIMRINVQFTDPVTSRAIWSDTYERNVKDVLAAQSDVVARIASGIGGALGGTPGTQQKSGANR